MKEYVATHSQSIYDISLILHGSIEGIFDILANNDLSVNDTIEPGTVILYDEEFLVNSQVVSWLADHKVNVANECDCIDYSSVSGQELRIVADQKGATSVISVELSSGTMLIDWGDGSAIDTIEAGAAYELDHPYREDGRHEIMIFGDFQLKDLDLSEIGGLYFALTSCTVSGTFSESTNRSDLKALFI